MADAPGTGSGPFDGDDEVWDETRWEAFLREHDARIARLMRHVTDFLADHPAPSREDTEAHAAWAARLRDHLRRLGWPDPPATDDPPADDPSAPFEPGSLRGDPFGGDPLDGFAGLTDALADDAPADDPLLAEAERIAEAVLAWADALPDDPPESAVADLVGAVLDVGGELAKARSFGTDREFLGGAIVCTRRALAAANTAFDALHGLRASRPFPRALAEALYELRNAVALALPDLRDRFARGVD